MTGLHAVVMAGPGIRGLSREIHCDPGHLSRALRGRRWSPALVAAAAVAVGFEEEALLELRRETRKLDRTLLRHQRGEASDEELLEALRRQQLAAQVAAQILESRAAGQQSGKGPTS